MKNKKQFAALFATNFCSVMNDNVLKTLVCFIGALWVSPEYRSAVVSLTAGALVLPYLIFSPLAGNLPMYCNKLKVLRWCKIAELPIMATAIIGFATQNIFVAIGAVLLMGLQSALFSPSKYGLIKDIGGIDGISQGMGGMEAIAFLGILLGTVAASFLAEDNNIIAYSSVLLALAAAGVAASFTLRVKETCEYTRTSSNVVQFIRDTNRILQKYRGLMGVIHLLSLFWWLSALIQIVLIIYCQDTLMLSPSQTGYVMAITAIGITLGCLVGGRLDRRMYLLGLTPLLGWIMAALLLIIFFANMSAVPFTMCIFAVAFVGGLFKIPLDAEIQKRVDTSELNIVLAYFNQISFIYIFLASATNILITALLPTRYVFLIMGIVFFVAMFVFMFNYHGALCFMGRTFLRAHYRIKSVGRENLQCAEGQNLLILPSHRAVIDPIMLFSELYDTKMQPLVDEGYFRIPVIGHVLSLFDAIEVPDLRLSRKGVAQVQALNQIVHNSLVDGCNVLFYPSGHITTDGRETIGTRQLAYATCLALPDTTKVVAVRIKGLWGSKWSRYHRTATPSIVKLLAMSMAMFASGAMWAKRKRNVTIEYLDITAEVRKWQLFSKLEFNKKLEELFNEGGEGEKAVE